MNTKLRVIHSLAIFLILQFAASAAELGDVNGDGRVSYADALRYAKSVFHPGDPAPPLADGSTDFEPVFPCSAHGSMVQLIEMEALRRATPNALPHFLEVWPPPPAPQAPTPPATNAVVVEVLPVSHEGPGNTFDLEVRLSTFVPLRGIQLVFEATGLELRPPGERDNHAKMFTTGEYTLLTHGRLVYHSDFPPAKDTGFEIGEYHLTFPVEVQRDTPAGEWEVRLVEGTEAVALDDTEWPVVVPATLSGELQIARPIHQGFTQPFPPLQFDEKERRVLGSTEFRLTDVSGRIGDEVSTRLQVRTARPFNHANVAVLFDGRVLNCIEATPLFVIPDKGVVDPEIVRISRGKGRTRFGEGFGAVYFDLDLTRKDYLIYDRASFFGSKPPSLEYVAPNEEWQDLAEMKFLIRGSAVGRESSPLKIWLYYTPREAIFLPYASRGTIGGEEICVEDGAWWTNETIAQSSRAAVLDSGPPRDLELPLPIESADIRYSIGNAEGLPGDVVRLPVTLETQVELHQLWHVIAYDPGRLELLGMDVPFLDGERRRVTVFVSPASWYADKPVACDKDEQGLLFNCRYGYPDAAILYGPWRSDGDFVPPGTVIATIRKNFGDESLEPEGRSWGPGAQHETLQLVFRIRDGASPGEAVVENAVADWQPLDYVAPWRLGSSGVPTLTWGDQSFERYDVPALSVNSGAVKVLGAIPFLRGDANQDGTLDLSDAVRTLGTLFLGAGSLSCPDAADANDDGAVNITDAVYSLDHLFRGGSAPPPPYPERGADPTADDLRCDA